MIYLKTFDLKFPLHVKFSRLCFQSISIECCTAAFEGIQSQLIFLKTFLHYSNHTLENLILIPAVKVSFLPPSSILKFC